MKSLWYALPAPVWACLLGGWAWRTGVAKFLPAGFDEVYYYLYSRHLSWSYFDHPPLVALTTGLGWWLTHQVTPLTLRWGALGLYTLSLWLLYQIATHLFDRRTGCLTIAIASLAPLPWLAFGVLTAPDNSLILAWTLTLWVAVQEFIPPARPRPTLAATPTYQPSWRLALLGMTLGLACLSKYHGFILGVGLLGFCLTTPRTRKALGSPWLLLALGLFALTLTPLWWWNSQHDWISFRFHLFMRFEGGTPSPYRVGDALGTWLLGIAYLFPTIGFPLWWSTARSLLQYLQDLRHPPMTQMEVIRRDRVALILWVSLPIAVGFTLLGGKQAIYPAWPAPGFWGLLMLLAHRASHWSPRLIHRWLVGSGLVLGSLMLVALLHLSLGILQKPGQYSLLGGFVPVQQDGSKSLLDVVQLRSRFAAAPSFMQALQAADFVFTDEWYLSGYVDMALQPLSDRPVTCFSQDPRGFVFWFDPDGWMGQNALYVTLASLHPDTAALVDEFAPYFQTLEQVTTIPLERGGIVTETVLVYQATQMHQTYPYPYPESAHLANTNQAAAPNQPNAVISLRAAASQGSYRAEHSRDIAIVSASPQS